MTDKTPILVFKNCQNHAEFQKTCTYCYEMSLGAAFGREGGLRHELESLRASLLAKERECGYLKHEPQGGHWHHYIDPGDGLPSPCKNSNLLEDIFKEQNDKIAELQTSLRNTQSELDTVIASRAEMAQRFAELAKLFNIQLS